MTTFVINGEIDDLFSHMALLGLASILEDADISSVRIWWNAEEQPVISGDFNEGMGKVAEIVHAHATAHAAPGSWLRDRFSFKNGSKTTTVSTTAPRTAAPADPLDWQQLDERRQKALVTMSSPLDHRLIQGLGYRSWWYRRGKDMRADIGANIWEMRTRNRGAEFVADRLLPLAEVLAKWSVDDIRSGLLGESLNDSHGKSKLDSRTVTGFSTPKPVDNARAWCALWALSLLPVVHLADPSGAYPAYLARGSIEGDSRHQMLMPVPAAPVSLARMRALLRSEQLIVAADCGVGSSELKRQAAWSWLQGLGTSALVRFPVRYVGSASAPERQALTGVRVWPS